MKKILVGVDGSEHSFKAVGQAGEIAQALKAQLFLISILEPVISPDWERELEEFARTEHIKHGVLGIMEEQAKNVLKREAERVRERGVERIETHVRVGEAAHEIIGFAQRNAVDLIAVGSRGRGPLAGLLLGSVSLKLVTHAPCAVLVVR